MRWRTASVSASVVALGVVCTALAFVAFFELIKEIGSTRSTIITYLNPAVAVILGGVLLGERFTLGTGVDPCVASLDCCYPETVDLRPARLGNGMATPQWTTLGLQGIRRVFG